MLNRKVKLFGKSVPLAVVLLVLTSVVAFAAWVLFGITANVSVTSQDFGPFELQGSPLKDYNSAEMSGSDCTYIETAVGSGIWDVTMTNAVPGHWCGLTLNYLNDGPIVGYAKVNEISGNTGLISTLDCNVAIGAAETQPVNFNYRLDPANSDPGILYNGVQVQIEFSPDPPTCP